MFIKVYYKHSKHEGEVLLALLKLSDRLSNEGLQPKTDNMWEQALFFLAKREQALLMYLKYIKRQILDNE